MTRTAEEIRWEVAPDPMHAAERAQTHAMINDLEALIQRLSAGACTAKCGRSEWDRIVRDLSFFPEMLRDGVEGR